MDEREVIIALGGNLGGEPAVMARFAAAAASIAARLGGRLRASRVYRTTPVGPVVDQPCFLNAVVACAPRVEATPTALMAMLLDIEAAHGRVRSEPAVPGPRTLDLDLLFVGDQVLATAGPPPVVLPHPRLAQRAFVLQPLADLQGLGWRMPGIARSIGECLAEPDVVRQRAEVTLYAGTITSAPRAT
jgi:2-amino-4-hydroxy-6-hydroxymethyldihydropteridine diphosphokinase